jgi:histidinol-phosphate/aromatic aminotransferase/cobyric acid decarboxylase-like protein
VPGWHLPITGLLQTGARVVFIANPNNPSATRVPLPALEYLATHLKGILVVDEAYIDYALDGDGMAASFLGKLDAYPNVVILRTFSKSYSMAGARLGLMFAHVELISHMNKVPPSPVERVTLPGALRASSAHARRRRPSPPLRWRGYAPERAALLATAGEGLVQRECTHTAGGRGGPA